MTFPRPNAPTAVGAGCALFIFVAFLSGWFTSWTPLEGTYARDYITLPKCGLAVRFGTDMFRSSEDYMWFGPVGNGWLSHPILCITAGVPTSYLPPFFGFKLFNLLYLALHLGIIFAFGRRLTAPYRARDIIVFAALGLFFPWYVMYHVGQYHALAVMALALVLAGPRRRVAGFVLSAVSKPVLAPAGIVLVTRGHFRETFKIVVIVALLTVPFALFGYTKETGLDFGSGSALADFISIGRDQAKLFVPGWDQQVSLAMLIDEALPSADNLELRVWLTIALVLLAVVGLRRSPIEVAFATASLWFFTYYARGHEYHATLVVPIFAYLWTEPRGVYRTRWVALLCVAFALPSPWRLFDVAPGPESFVLMREHSEILFWLFVGLKPVAALLLAVTIGWKELRPAQLKRKSSVPRSEKTLSPA